MSGRRAGRTAVALGLVALLVLIALLLRQERGGAEAGSPPGEPSASSAATDRVGATDPAAPELPTVDGKAGESVAATALASPQDASLRVRVTWAPDGAPAADYSLRILSWDIPEGRRYSRIVRTDAHGEWFGSPMPLGKVTAYTFVGPAKTVTLAAGDAAEIELVIPVGVTVNGLVTDGQGAAVPGADIWMSEAGNLSEGAVVATADDRGRFTLRGLVPSPVQASGHYLVARSAHHAPSGRSKVSGEAGQTVDMTLVVGGPCGTVGGTVVDSKSAPVAGATVRIGNEMGFYRTAKQAEQKELPSSAFLATSDARGEFAIPGVPVGRAPVAAVAAGHSPCDTSCDVKEGDNELQLVLPDAARIHGTVRDARGQPLAGADVWIEPHYELLGSEASSAADGSYEFRDVDLGVRLVRASEKDNGLDVQRLEVTPGADLTCDLVLGAGSTISGTLLDADDKPAPGWLLQAVPQVPSNGRSDPGARFVTDRSRADGRFRLTNVPAGEQRLIVMGKTLGNMQRLLAEHVASGASDLVLHLPLDVEKLGGLTARFVDESGAPLPGAKVTPQLLELQTNWLELVADASGRVLAEQLPLAAWSLTAKADGYPATTFGPFTVAPGPVTDVGDLVLKRGATLLVHLTADAPLDQGWIRGAFKPDAAAYGSEGKLDGALMRFPPCAPGSGLLTIDALHFVALRQTIELAAGAETSVDVHLSTGLVQHLRFWAPAAQLASAAGTRVRYEVRDAGGVVLISRDTMLPPYEGSLPDASLPFLELVEVVAPGTYTLDASVNDASRTGLRLTASADAPWDIDLR